MIRKLSLAFAAIIAGLSCMAKDSILDAEFSYTPTRFYFQRASLFEVLPVDSTDIIMLGNSITNGCEWHELLNNPNVKNRGINGDVVEGVTKRLPSIINGHPAKIFLLIGVNDISWAIEPEAIAESILQAARTIRKQSPSTRLYIQSILPFNDTLGIWKKLEGRISSVGKINAILKANADNIGYTFVDIHDAFADESGRLRTDLSNDGLHLLGNGYLIWRDLLKPYLD